MPVLRCLWGAILGAIGGIIAAAVGVYPLMLVTVLIMGNSSQSVDVANRIALLFVPAGIIIGTIISIRDASAEKAARLRRHKEEQQGYRKQMLVLGEESIGLFESMPKFLSSAEKYLDQAEVDFADGAFAPFWDSIENAAKTLGRFDEGVHHIKNNSSRYTELITKCEDTPPQFPLAPQSVVKLGVGTTTAERMKTIVRTAQRNFQFATIYEQRKTNQILVAGFTSLAQALDRMTSQITASIDELAGSVDVLSSTLNESMRAIHSRVGDIAEMISDGAARERNEMGSNLLLTVNALLW